MGKRDDLIAVYAGDLRDKCGVTPDMDLLTKVTIGLGPALYDADATLVSGSDEDELERVRRNFLIGKLGLADGPELGAGIDAVIEQYGRDNRSKHRAVVYYLLAVRFGKEAVYG